MNSKNTAPAQVFAIERSGSYALARPTQRIEECPDCGGTGLLRSAVTENGRRYEVVNACPRSAQAKRAALFNAARLPAVHAQADFENYRPSNAEQARALQVARDFAHRWPLPKGFIVSGPVGTGKTHLLVATVKHLALELGVSCGYEEIGLLYSEIRRGFQEGKSGGEIIGPLSRLDLLVIDELGKGRGSVFELETLGELIARRYNGGKVTLFATNYSLVPPEERKQSGYIDTATTLEASRESKFLSDQVGDRIYSRLCEMCDFVELPSTTPDARRSSNRVHAPSNARRR